MGTRKPLLATSRGLDELFDPFSSLLRGFMPVPAWTCGTNHAGWLPTTYSVARSFTSPSNFTYVLDSILTIVAFFYSYRFTVFPSHSETPVDV